MNVPQLVVVGHVSKFCEAFVCAVAVAKQNENITANACILKKAVTAASSCDFRTLANTIIYGDSLTLGITTQRPPL